MRIGIMSDTHDQLKRASRAARRLVNEGAETLIHCGDLTRPDIVYECAVIPTYFVFGNNDYDEDGLRKAMDLAGAVCLGHSGLIELGGKRIAVTHGDSSREMNRLASLGPDYLFFGHSHWPADDRNGSTRCINPGALYRAALWTVALLDLDTGALQLLTIDDHR
jgi:uncharacterized protein